MRIAIQQPYFVPYTGYFRLLAASDLFISYDDVQFIKGGWIHRNKLTRHFGEKDWCTLPIKHPSLGTLIKDLQWQDSSDPIEMLYDMLRRFPALKNDSKFICAPQTESPVAYILNGLFHCCLRMNIPFNVKLSSAENIRPDLHGQDRVLAICEHFKATEYINAPGGRKLYDPEEFEKRGIELKFLSPYQDKASIVDRIHTEGAESVRKDIYEHITFS